MVERGRNLLGHDMSNISQIVCGGGWKGTRSEKVKIKAWLALFNAIVLAGISVTASSAIWIICAAVLAGLTFLIATMFFTREKPRDLQFPHRRAGHDPRKLYACHGSTAQSIRRNPSALPKHGK